MPRVNIFMAFSTANSPASHFFGFFFFICIKNSVQRTSNFVHVSFSFLFVSLAFRSWIHAQRKTLNCSKINEKNGSRYVRNETTDESQKNINEIMKILYWKWAISFLLIVAHVSREIKWKHRANNLFDIQLSDTTTTSKAVECEHFLIRGEKYSCADSKTPKRREKLKMRNEKEWK